MAIFERDRSVLGILSVCVSNDLLTASIDLLNGDKGVTLEARVGILFKLWEAA